MHMIRKIVPSLTLTLWLVFIAMYDVRAEGIEKPVDVYLFWGEGCSHCAEAINFARQFSDKEPGVRMHYLEVTGPPRTGKFLQARSGISAYNGREFH